MAKLKKKAYGQRIHAKKRAWERHGVMLATADLHEMVRMIQEGKAEALGRKTCRISMFRVRWEGLTLEVAYDRKRKEIATVLPSRD